MINKRGWSELLKLRPSRTKSRSTVAALISLYLSACASPVPYVQPPSLTPAAGATIIGSTTVVPDATQTNARIYLNGVDNMRTNMTWRDWNTPVLVTAGSHLVDIVPCWCGAFSYIRSGELAQQITLDAGKTYVLTSDVPTGNGYWGQVKVWIADSSGKPVSTKTVVKLTSPETPPIVALFAPK